MQASVNKTFPKGLMDEEGNGTIVEKNAHSVLDGINYSKREEFPH
jgi:hypothetical protein